MKPTGARRWVVVFALTLAMIMYIQRVAISQAAGPISSELHLNKSQMGLVFSAFGLSYALFELPMGLLGDRLGARRILAQIVLGWSLFAALTGAAWSLVSLWAIRFLFGAGEAGCFPNLTRMLSAWLPVGERVKAQGLMWAFGRWGGAAAPPLAYLVISLVGWRWGFVALAMLGVVWCAAFLAWFKDDPAEHKGVNKTELELLQSARALVLHDQGVSGYRLLLQRDIFFLGLQYFCFSYTWYFYVTWLPSWLQQARGQSASIAAGYAILPLLMGGFGCIVSGIMPLTITRRWLAFGGFALTGILLCVIPHVRNINVTMGLMAAASFSSDLTMPISWNSCVEIGKRYTATVAATMNMLGNFAGFVAPVLGGIILDRTANDWNIVLYMMAGAAFVSAICWIFLDPERAGRVRSVGRPAIG